MIDQVLTIGAYGFGPDEFFEALEKAGVDVFLDVRQRRGMRGARYAFANSSRLQEELARRGIAYRHVKELAPGTETRDLQRAADRAGGVAKSARAELTPPFVEGYRHLYVDPFDWSGLLKGFQDFRTPVLFCVERDPGACHRTLAADRLAEVANAEVVHLLP